MDKTTSDLNALIRARNTLLWVVTREEARVEACIKEAAMAAKYRTLFWDVATGVTDEQGAKIDGSQTAPLQALGRVRDAQEQTVFVLRDLHKWMDPVTLRTIRSVARALQAQDISKTMIILTPSSEIPPELTGSAIVVDWPLPTRDDIADLLKLVIESQADDHPARKLKALVREAAVDAAMGLMLEEAGACYAKSLAMTKTIDPSLVSQEKKRVIAREKVLTWYDPDSRGLDAIGGLGLLKEWLVVRAVAFTKKARTYGLPVPKGVLLIGVPGCGKSLTAKAVAAAYGKPLLRLDMGALRSKWVGESEANIRKALQTAEIIAPCVLWIDEIEKAMAGAGGGGASDGGVSTDALGTVLTWMQERKTPVFVIATANDVSSLPPELLRKGRWDEMFFIDLPNQQERIEVLAANLKLFNIAAEGIKLSSVAAACNQFSGAEIAALVPDAMFIAFNDSERGITTRDLLDVSAKTVPLAKSSAEKIGELRLWARDRTRPASMTEIETKGNRFNVN